jgi:hypothetical protein
MFHIIIALADYPSPLVWSGAIVRSNYVLRARLSFPICRTMGCHMEIETPPGLKYMNLTYLASGGDENTWLPFTKVKYYTNAFIVKDNKV